MARSITLRKPSSSEDDSKGNGASNDFDFMKGIVKEISVMQKLSKPMYEHPNIIKLLEVYNSPSHTLLQMKKMALRTCTATCGDSKSSAFLSLCTRPRVSSHSFGAAGLLTAFYTV